MFKKTTFSIHINLQWKKETKTMLGQSIGLHISFELEY